MSVEIDYIGVYGYRFTGRVPYDKIAREKGYDASEELLKYDDTDANKGSFVFFQDPRGDDYTIGGLLYFVSDYPWWGADYEYIEPTVLDGFSEEKVEEMEEIIDEKFSEYVSRKSDEPKNIVFTHIH